MHILQVTPRYPPNMGGVETVVQKLSETLVKRGVAVTVYTVDLSRNTCTRKKINTILVKRFIPVVGDPLFLPEPRFILSMLKEKADIIHVHNIHILLPLFAALLKHGNQKLVLQPHYHRFGQSSLRHAMLKLYRHLLHTAIMPRTNAVIVNSAYEAKIFSEDFPCKNILLIPEGIDVKEAKQVRHTPKEPKKILYVGTLKGYKHVDKVLEGFARLIADEHVSYELVIIGEGPQHDSLVQLASDLGISQHIRWKKELSRRQLLQEYAEASALVLLSSLESFSRVVYEALLIGVPVVVLKDGPLAHLVQIGLAEGVNSLSSAEIAHAFQRAIARKWQKKEKIAGVLDWEEYTEKIVALYSKI
ncbi:glycosyltransferase family 4 protein [Candidatus Bathyarchaeota archaeon]|nr:glycosyltransferase family 4 protein [Candidatus Bathyarchaeota archaeon]